MLRGSAGTPLRLSVGTPLKGLVGTPLMRNLSTTLFYTRVSSYTDWINEIIEGN